MCQVHSLLLLWRLKENLRTFLSRNFLEKKFCEIKETTYLQCSRVMPSVAEIYSLLTLEYFANFSIMLFSKFQNFLREIKTSPKVQCKNWKNGFRKLNFSYISRFFAEESAKDNFSRILHLALILIFRWIKDYWKSLQAPKSLHFWMVVVQKKLKKLLI